MPTGITSPPTIQRVGRYTLHHKLASGGMGSVFLGLAHAPGGFCRVVAIKCLRIESRDDASGRLMMLDEARLAGRVRHPNVVSVLDLLDSDDQLFLVMEYVRGEPLSRLLFRSHETQSPVPTSILVAVLSDALRGLHAAHEVQDRDGSPLGLVHRDVSPHNILVGTDGLSRITDFGVAKARGRLQGSTQARIKGKVGYMAPEHFSGGDMDRRADLFAAGIVLWEGAIGRGMFEGLDDAQVVARVLFEEPARPSDVAGQSVVLEDIILKALKRRPEDRFASALEMAEAMVQVVAPASPSAVAAWVQGMFADELAARDVVVRKMELEAERISSIPPQSIETLGELAAGRTSTEMVRPVPSSFPLKSRPKRKVGVVMFMAIVLVGCVVAGTLLLGTQREATSGASGAPSISASAARLSASLAASLAGFACVMPSSRPVASNTASPPPGPEPSWLAGKRDDATPATGSAPSKPGPHRKSEKVVDCNPPFTLDADGYRQYKVECL